MQDVYVNEREKIFKGGYLVEVVVYDQKKVLWEVAKDNSQKSQMIMMRQYYRGLISIYFNTYKKGVVREGFSEFPYLLMLIKLWTGCFKTQLKRMNQKFDEDNGKSLGKGNLRY